jgi:hypothetical protein
LTSRFPLSTRFGTRPHGTAATRLERRFLPLRRLTGATRLEENWRQNHLADQLVYLLLEKVDADLTEKACQEGCLICGGPLDRTCTGFPITTSK